MKRYLILCCIVFFTAFVLYANPCHSEEPAAIRHWYRLEIQTGDTTYQCLGSSFFDEKEFARQMAGTELVPLDDVAYLDNTGKLKGWQEWDPKSQPRLYINPKYVIFFNPMKGDPKKATVPKPAGK